VMVAMKQDVSHMHHVHLAQFHSRLVLFEFDKIYQHPFEKQNIF